MVHEIHRNGLYLSIVCFHHDLDLGLLEQLSDSMEAHLRQLGLPMAKERCGKPAVQLQGVQRGQCADPRAGPHTEAFWV